MTRRAWPSRSSCTPVAYSRTVLQISSHDRDSLPGEHTTTSNAKNPLEACDVAGLDCGDERIEKTSALGRIRRGPSTIRDVLARARHHLPRVGLFKPQTVRDFPVWIVERLAQDISGSFRGR